MINEIFRSALSFLRYFSPTPSRIAGPPTPAVLAKSMRYEFEQVRQHDRFRRAQHEPPPTHSGPFVKKQVALD